MTQLEYATPANKELNGQIYALIGALYCKLTDYNKAIEMNEKAISIFKSIGDPFLSHYATMIVASSIIP